MQRKPSSKRYLKMALFDLTSPWGSPILMVPKKSSDWRLVGDYRNLNLKTKRDYYPLPYLNDFSIKLHDHNYFLCIDLKDILSTRFQLLQKILRKTPFRLFECTRMSFHLCGAAQTFHRFIYAALTVKLINGVEGTQDDPFQLY